MEKVVFLDIDGVLNDNSSDFVDSCVESVKELVSKNDAKVVMITSLQGNGTGRRRKKDEAGKNHLWFEDFSLNLSKS